MGLLKAKAEFAVSGPSQNRQLTVTLSNTSPNDVTVPQEVLCGVLFKTTGVAPGAMARLGANVAGGSSIKFESPAYPGKDVGGEWVYDEGLTGLYNGNVDRGIAGAGFGLFGPEDIFGGSDRNNHQAPDGLDYGILSAGDDLSTGNSAVTGTIPLIKSSVVFTFSVSSNFSESSIIASSVVFQYGTSLSETSHGPGVPEPITMLPLAAALALTRPQTRARRCANRSAR